VSVLAAKFPLPILSRNLRRLIDALPGGRRKFREPCTSLGFLFFFHKEQPTSYAVNLRTHPLQTVEIESALETLFCVSLGASVRIRTSAIWLVCVGMLVRALEIEPSVQPLFCVCANQLTHTENSRPCNRNRTQREVYAKSTSSALKWTRS
jgi:hypothetical protein